MVLKIKFNQGAANIYTTLINSFVGRVYFSTKNPENVQIPFVNKVKEVKKENKGFAGRPQSMDIMRHYKIPQKDFMHLFILLLIKTFRSVKPRVINDYLIFKCILTIK